MKQEEMNRNALTDEELTEVSGGNKADRVEDLTYSFKPGDRVEYHRQSYPKGTEIFYGEIISTTYIMDPDRFDRSYHSAYNVLLDGSSETVVVTEYFLRKI